MQEVTQDIAIKSRIGIEENIFETEFMASEMFFDNTAFFHTTYGMLHFNPDSGNPPVLLFFNNSKLFSFRFLLGHAYFNTIRSVSDEAGILPKPAAST